MTVPDVPAREGVLAAFPSPADEDARVALPPESRGKALPEQATHRNQSGIRPSGKELMRRAAVQ